MPRAGGVMRSFETAALLRSRDSGLHSSTSRAAAAIYSAAHCLDEFVPDRGLRVNPSIGASRVLGSLRHTGITLHNMASGG